MIPLRWFYFKFHELRKFKGYCTLMRSKVVRSYNPWLVEYWCIFISAAQKRWLSLIANSTMRWWCKSWWWWWLRRWCRGCIWTTCRRWMDLWWCGQLVVMTILVPVWVSTHWWPSRWGWWRWKRRRCLWSWWCWGLCGRAIFISCVGCVEGREGPWGMRDSINRRRGGRGGSQRTWSATYRSWG